MTTQGAQRDQDQIMAHVRSIFDAYIRRDRDAIEGTHTPDWVGFLIPSRRIERGIGAYMTCADSSLERFRGAGYELHDTELQVYGDVAVLYYVASYHCRDGQGNELTLPLRSVDVYRRQGGHWNQCGSNICLLPPDENTGRSVDSEGHAVSLTPAEQGELLAAREAVWRAWFANDADHLRTVLPANVIAIDAGRSEWADRDEVLERAAAFAGGGAKLLRLEFPETRIQAHGPVAVLYTTYLFEVETRGERTIHSGRGTEIFARRDGAWINTGWHLDSGK